MNLQATDPMLVSDVVDNPEFVIGYGNERKSKVVRALRNDPLGCMFARNQIGPVEHAAARQWQRDFEAAGPHQKSPGYLEEPVDGSRPMRDGITDRQLTASRRLESYRRLLGPRQHQLVTLVLADKCSLWAATTKMFPDDLSPPRRRFVGTWFRECLAVMAKAMGLMT